MSNSLNVNQALQTAIAAVRALQDADGAAPIRVDLARIEASLIVARETLSRCNIETLPPVQS